MLDSFRNVIRDVIYVAKIIYLILSLIAYVIINSIGPCFPRSFTDSIHLLYVKTMQSLGLYDANKVSHYFVTWEAPLVHALRWGHINTFRHLILKAGANVYAPMSKFSNTLIDATVSLGHKDIALWLVRDVGVDINAATSLTLNTALHGIISRGGKIEDVRFVIEELGADIEAKNHLNETALHCAITAGRVDIVHLLVENHNANIHAIAANGKTPLHYATNIFREKDSVRLEIIQILVSKGANVGALDSSNHTPLRSACYEGRLSVINFLLSFDTISNKPHIGEELAVNKNYALRMAAKKGDLEMLNKLLAYPEVVAEIAIDNNVILREARNNSHRHIEDRLLQFPEVRNFDGDVSQLSASPLVFSTSASPSTTSILPPGNQSQESVMRRLAVK